MTGRWSLVVAGAAATALAAACGAGSDKAGTSHIDMDDVRGTSLGSRFAGPPVPVTGHVSAHDDGCVTVVVDGVERMPVWPDGTSVTPSGDSPARYVVELSGGVRLTTADAGRGDSFTAAGVVAEGRSAGPSGWEEPGKAESFLDFCDVEAAPIAFPDAATFRSLG